MIERDSIYKGEADSPGEEDPLPLLPLPLQQCLIETLRSERHHDYWSRPVNHMIEGVCLACLLIKK